MKQKTKKQKQNITDEFQEFQGKFRISQEEKEKIKKEYDGLNKALMYSENLYNSVDFIKINIASPRTIRKWGRRNLPVNSSKYYPKYGRKNIDEKLKNKKKENERFSTYYDVGHVQYPYTINFKTLFPAKYGLFCPSIFGPVVSWQCSCEKYRTKPKRYLFRYCEKCEIELTDSRVRRYRMGYSILAIPITHFWYFTGRPNYLKQIIDAKIGTFNKVEDFYEEEENDETLTGGDKCKKDDLLAIIYGHRDISDPDYGKPLEEYTISNSIVLTPNEKQRIAKVFKDIIALEEFYSTEEAYEMARDVVFESTRASKEIPRRKFGSEILDAFFNDYKVVDQIDNLRIVLTSTIFSSRKYYQFPPSAPNEYPKGFDRFQKDALGKLRILESFHATKTELNWMLLTYLPILPAGLRPISSVGDGPFLTSDLNVFYSEILKKSQSLEEIKSFQFFVSLQIAVDQLIDNARTDEPRKRKLHSLTFKSLTEALETKEGRFRLNLFGKRVNYSARSVIIVGPYLRINQCAMPYKIAKTLFAPLLQRKVLELQKINAIYHPIIAQSIIKLNPLKIFTILSVLAEEYSILLNRAPTLHKFGIQSFEPIISLTQAIELHPLVCTGFNADFDGDQMGLYLPLYKVSQLEILHFMKSSSNIFSPTNGEPILKPTQDMVIGAHYLTSLIVDSQDFSQNYFSNEEQVILRFYQKKCSIHTRVLVNYPFENQRFMVKKNELFFFTDFLPFFNKKIILQKIFYSQGSYSVSGFVKKAYLFTNVGIIVAKRFSNTSYEILNLLLETTPGRILFEKYIKASIQKVLTT